MQAFAKALTAFLDFLDQRMVMRRAAFVWTLWLTQKCVFWSIDYATTSSRGGMEVAAIIAAVWAPMTALQGAIFHLYNNGRRDQQDPQDQGH